MRPLDKVIPFLAARSDRLAQALNLNHGPVSILETDPRKAALCRRGGAEGMVLLKNDGTLPLNPREQTAFFGRCQNDWFYVGYGSGGDVNPPYRVSPMDAVRARGLPFRQDIALEYEAFSRENVPFTGIWGLWPTCYEEMPLSEVQVRRAARTAKTAVVFLGRATGESMDQKPRRGGWYLTVREERMLRLVTAAFPKTVVVICAGGLMDLSWTEGYGNAIGGILYAYHGGMESGNAVVDVLCGETCPSGHLTDTVLRKLGDRPTRSSFGHPHHSDYKENIYVGYRYFETFAPERVLYPFGYGLSYTSFSLQAQCLPREDGCGLAVTVTNTGKRPGAEVVQVYVSAPQGKLGKPARVLGAFRKTRVLAPGEEEVLELTLKAEAFASFDDTGATGNRNAYVLEPGEYSVFVGENVRDAGKAGSFFVPSLRVLSCHEPLAVPVRPLKRLTRTGWERLEALTGGQKERILASLPPELPITGDRGILFRQVPEGEASMDAFLAQLTEDQLEALTRGQGAMNSPQGAAGNAGILGGTTARLRDLGIPPITTTDGPSGIRLSCSASLLPCGTALACTWDPALLEALGQLLGQEMAQRGSDILLGPGLNLHRDPLCGRNFEYFSEDPYISGKMAAALVRGIQSVPGRAACPKHFACNNQEFMRSRHDSRLSPRALRELYLKGFEICVKEGNPLVLMTSYNKVNGTWAHYSHDLATGILRHEWGFRGLVITDWWMQPARDPHFPGNFNDGYRLRAQVDVLMPGGTHNGRAEGDGSALASRKAGGLTLGELQRSARNVLNFILTLKKEV